MIDIKAETLEETLSRFKTAAYMLWPWNPRVVPSPLGKRGKINYFFHTMMNIMTEAVRRNAQFAAKTILFGFPTVILLYEWGNSTTGI